MDESQVAASTDAEVTQETAVETTDSPTDAVETSTSQDQAEASDSSQAESEQGADIQETANEETQEQKPSRSESRQRQLIEQLKAKDRLIDELQAKSSQQLDPNEYLTAEEALSISQQQVQLVEARRQIEQNQQTTFSDIEAVENDPKFQEAYKVDPHLADDIQREFDSYVAVYEKTEDGQEVFVGSRERFKDFATRKLEAWQRAQKHGMALGQSARDNMAGSSDDPSRGGSSASTDSLEALEERLSNVTF